MSAAVQWYRSADPPPAVARSMRRRLRDSIRRLLPDPDVHGRVMVMHSRRTLPKPSWHGVRSEFHGFFSEYHSVLGAVVYGQEHGATGVRVDFRSSLYVDPSRGPNWWTYFFERDLMPLNGAAAAAPEVHLDRIVTKYGRFGGFADIVQGATPYYYPMTFGVDRRTLHELAARFVTIRPEIIAEAEALTRSVFEPGAFVVGVHYRGTDAVHGRAAVLAHYRTERTSYAVYVDEVRRAIEGAGAARHQVFVATDETHFVDAMRRAFPGRIVALDAPRAAAGGRAVHLDPTLRATNYEKGKSALLDALLLASTHYLVKGRSNLSDAALVFNPDLPFSFCPDVRIDPAG